MAISTRHETRGAVATTTFVEAPQPCGLAEARPYRPQAQSPLSTVVMHSVELLERVEAKSITLLPAQRTGVASLHRRRLHRQR